MKIGKFSAVSLLAVVPLVLLTANPASAATPTYYPSGPQQNVSKQTLVDGGWTLCWSGGYGETDSLSNIYASCTGDYILYAGGLTGADSYMLLAAGKRDMVFVQTARNVTIEENGTFWYLNPSQSMGFAPTATISQSSADVYDAWGGTTGWGRLSWHTGYCGAEKICGGWRVGSTTGLNGDNNYTRAIWQSGGGGFIAQPAVSQEEYDTLQAQYDELMTDYTALVDTYNATEATLQALMIEYQDYVSYAEARFGQDATTIADQESTIADQGSIIAGKDSTISELQSAIDQYKIIIDDKNMTIASYMNKVDSLNEAIAALQSSVSDLSAQLQSANDTIAILNQALEDANGKIVSTEKQLAEVLEILAKSKSDYELERAKSVDLNKQLIAAQARIKELEEKLTEVQNKLDDMTAKQSTTQKQLDDARAQIDTLVQQLKDANETIRQQKDKLDQIQALTSEEGATQNLALAEELTDIAMAKFEVAEQGSEEYQLALEMLAVAAVADDPDLPEELAALPVLGAVAGSVLNVMNDLGNIGADIAPEQRERAEEIVVASVIAGNIAVSAGASAPSGGARRKV